MVTEAHVRTSRPAGKSPIRTCVVTRREAPAGELIRFAAAPDGVIVPDLSGNLPGRGVWIDCDHKLVADAVRTKAFARALKRDVKADPGLPGLVADLMTQRALAALSLANKAGLVLTGFSKVDTAIAGGGVLALVHASDASADGIEKLDRRYRAMCRDAGRTTRIERSFANAQMSLALGRSNVVHAALMTGGAAQNFLSQAGRLERYRTGRLNVESLAAAERLPPTDHTEE